MSDEDDLFGSSDSGGDTDDLIADAKKAPAAKKRLQKKAVPAATKKRKLPGESSLCIEGLVPCCFPYLSVTCDCTYPLAPCTLSSRY